jgi:ABC-type sugar transport system substrate-binding protein
MRRNPRTLAAFAFILAVCSLAGIAAQAPAEPRRFAILVGINQYSDPGLVSLQKAQNDAEDLGKALSRLGAATGASP